MYFHVRRGELGRWTVVHVTGEIDLATAPRYRSELVGAAAAATDLAVDLTDCDLIDSVGLGVTLGGARRMRDRGGSFAVIVNDRVRRSFERCRLDEILDLVGDPTVLQSGGPSSTAAVTAVTATPGSSGPS